MKHRFPRLTAAVLVVTFLAGLSACGPSSDRRNDVVLPPIVSEDSETTLTYVFAESRVTLPEGMEPDSQVRPFVSKNELTFLCLNQNQEAEKRHFLCTVSLNQEAEPVFVPLDTGENFYQASAGCITEDRVILAVSGTDEVSHASRTTLLSCHRTDGTVDKLENLEYQLPDAKGSPSVFSAVVIDGEGDLCYADAARLCVFTPELTKVFDWVSPEEIRGLIPRDGQIFVITDRAVYPLEKKNRGVGTVCPLPDDAVMGKLFCGTSDDWFYGNDRGLYRWKEGMEEGELFLNWENSRLSYRSVCDLVVLSPERLFAISTEGSGLSFSFYPAFLTPTENVDLTETVTVNAAYFYSPYLGCPYIEPTVRFNQENPGIRVVGEDYTAYNSRETGENGGTTKLINDLLTGLANVDLICAEVGSDVAAALLDNDLCADLYQWIDGDPDVHRDDIVGAVRNTYEIDGKLLAAVPAFRLKTVLAPASWIGDRTWTLAEMLKTAADLPEGVQLIKEKSSLFAGTSVYASFIDWESGTCRFDDPVFAELLAFLKTKDQDVSRGHNPYAPYQTGEVLLFPKTYARRRAFPARISTAMR